MLLLGNVVLLRDLVLLLQKNLVLLLLGNVVLLLRTLFLLLLHVLLMTGVNGAVVCEAWLQAHEKLLHEVAAQIGQTGVQVFPEQVVVELKVGNERISYLLIDNIQ